MSAIIGEPIFRGKENGNDVYVWGLDRPCTPKLSARRADDGSIALKKITNDEYESLKNPASSEPAQ